MLENRPGGNKTDVLGLKLLEVPFKSVCLQEMPKPSGSYSLREMLLEKICFVLIAPAPGQFLTNGVIFSLIGQGIQSGV